MRRRDRRFPRRPDRPPAATISRPWSIRSRASPRPSASACAPHFTNLDRPVFALVNLPETVKGALFARYSRYPGHAAAAVPRRVRRRPAGRRRALATAARASARRSCTSGSSSATATTRSPSSAARTSPASGSRTSSPRCSSARGSAPTSSSRRATSPTTRRCPAPAATATTATPSSAPSTSARWTSCSRSTRGRCPRVCAWAEERVPARRRRAAGRPRARDQGQGARPAARAAAGQLALAHGHLRHRPDLRAADPAPARAPAARGPRLRADDPRRAQGGDAELRGPRRAPRPRRRVDRATCEARERAGAPLGRAARARREPARTDRPVRRSRCCTSTATRTTCSPRCCSRPARRSEERIRDAVAALDADERAALLADLVGERAQPPPPPGPRLRGAALPLRDRLRLRRLPRPAAPPDADRPVAVADARPRRRTCPSRSSWPAAATSTAARSRSRGASTSASSTPACERAAPYALCLGYRIRYVLDLNAREAMQLIELRSGREGHPSYRAVAHEMHAQIERGAPGGRRDDDPRRPRDRAAARADPVRDAHPGAGDRRPLSGARRRLPVRAAADRKQPARLTSSTP